MSVLSSDQQVLGLIDGVQDAAFETEKAHDYLRFVLESEAWRSYRTPNGVRVEHTDFAEFITRRRPFGLSSLTARVTPDTLRELAEGDDVLTALLDRELGPVSTTTLDPTTPGRTVVGLDLSLTASAISVIDLATGTLATAVHRSPAPKDDVLGAHVIRHRELVDGIVQQVLACDPALVVVEGLQFSVAAKDSSLTRRGFLWWAVAEGLVAGGAPVLEVAPSQIKQLATGKGNAGKSEVVAAYASTWPDAVRDKNIEDRADASFAAALGTAYLRRDVLPFKLTGTRRKALAKVGRPSIPPRLGDAPAAA